MKVWSERFLWIHVAGLAVLPIMLGLCLLGLAVGEPTLPVWVELLLVGSTSIAPVLWMQWQRPFYIFSILAVALKPEKLTSDQQRLLRLFKARSARLWAVIAAAVSAIALWQLYQIAPIATGVVPLQSHLLGLLLASIALLASNLFFQVPLSALRILVTSNAKVEATEPYPAAEIRQNFTVLGLQVQQILPPLETETPSN